MLVNLAKTTETPEVIASSVQVNEEEIEITEEAEKTCSAIREQAALKKEEAVKAVIGKVVGEYGSC